MVLNNVKLNPADTKHKLQPGDSLLVLDILVMANNGALYRTYPAIRLNHDNSGIVADSVIAEGLTFQFSKLMPDQKTFEVAVKESKVLPAFVTLKVYEFPMINVLWLGVVVMFFGFILSMYYRVQQLRARPLIKK
jgi:cytochrome c-type biogenesis protein CcmF